MTQRPQKKAFKWILGAVVISAAVIVISLLQLSDNLVYFYTPAEAYAKSATLAGQVVRVGGMVQQGSVVWKAEDLSLSFLMTDTQNHNIQVSHHGTPPDMFKEGQGVVVEGRLENDGHAMIAHKLMVKHSEEYKKPDEHQSMDKALLEKSLFKD